MTLSWRGYICERRGGVMAGRGAGKRCGVFMAYVRGRDKQQADRSGSRSSNMCAGVTRRGRALQSSGVVIVLISCRRALGMHRYSSRAACLMGVGHHPYGSNWQQISRAAQSKAEQSRQGIECWDSLKHEGPSIYVCGGGLLVLYRCCQQFTCESNKY